MSLSISRRKEILNKHLCRNFFEENRMPVLEMHIRISPGTKFQNKLMILIFSTKSTQKGYLQSKSEQVNITTEFFIFKLEENNDIFLAGGDALVFLAEPMHKKYSATFAWGHPFSTYVSYDRC